MITPQVKTGLTHAGTALGGAVAAISFLSQHQVDIYALFNQLNEIVAAITKFIALVAPLATAAYGIYRSSATVRATEVMQDPKSIAVAKALPVTPVTAAVAEALKKE